jgi:hypothetical protein
MTIGLAPPLLLDFIATFSEKVFFFLLFAFDIFNPYFLIKKTKLRMTLISRKQSQVGKQ